jgi:hypothetical protein
MRNQIFGSFGSLRKQHIDPNQGIAREAIIDRLDTGQSAGLATKYSKQLPDA